MGKLSRGNSLLVSMAHSLSFSRPHSHAFSSSLPNFDAGLLKFETGLTERLSSLRSTHTISANLNWLLDALAVANSTQTSLISILPKLSQNKQKLLQRLESTVGLLDVCNALKEAIADIRDYLARLQKAVKHLSQAVTTSQKSRSIHGAAMRLQTCLARMEAGNQKRWQSRLDDACRSLKLFRKQMQKAANTDLHSHAECSTLMQVVDDATLTIALILSAMASSFNSAPKRAKLCRTNSNVVSGMSCLLSSSSLKSLQRDLAHEDACGTVFQELEGLQLAALALQHVSGEPVITRLAAEAVMKKAREMELSLAELSPKLDSLFRSLAAIRLQALS